MPPNARTAPRSTRHRSPPLPPTQQCIRGRYAPRLTTPFRCSPLSTILHALRHSATATISHNYEVGGSSTGTYQAGRSLTLDEKRQFHRYGLLVLPYSRLPKGWVISMSGLAVPQLPITEEVFEHAIQAWQDEIAEAATSSRMTLVIRGVEQLLAVVIHLRRIYNFLVPCLIIYQCHVFL